MGIAHSIRAMRLKPYDDMGSLLKQAKNELPCV
jgi:hypothetical protein